MKTDDGRADRAAVRAETSSDAVRTASSQPPSFLPSLNTRTVLMQGYGGDEVEAYLACPASNRTRAGVIVIHPVFGYSRATIGSVVRLAWLGYDTICPNLFWREAPGAAPCAASAMARLNGGVPDDRVIGDVEGARSYLRSLPSSNGKVGIVGFGAGAREAVLAACNVDFDAAVDCYGEFIVGPQPDGMFPIQTASIVEHLPKLRAPLLGLFGKEDTSPDREQVAELAQILDEEDKPHEFHSYDHAGHGFLSLDHATYRPYAANDAWDRIAAFLALHLGSDSGSQKGP
jgi:carboxymethylenebutenolidase